LPVQTPAPRFLRLRTAANDAGIAKKHREILPPCLPVPHRRSAEWVIESQAQVASSGRQVSLRFSIQVTVFLP
jgi:hypothetical protein